MGAVQRIKTFTFRTSVVIGVAALAAVCLWFTPLPHMYHASCERSCHELDWPMICRFKFTFEAHRVLGSWCGDCPHNSTDCLRKGCFTVDGLTRRVLTANRQLPGPSIQVCENDILVVDIVNRLAGQAVAVHWRGQQQLGSPYMDGVAMVTQCPIPSYTTFQYKFRAAEAGTHLWQAHTGNEILDGLFGPLIVRQSDRREAHRKLYDVDDKEHVIIINQWTNAANLAQDDSAASLLLVNGRYAKGSKKLPMSTLKVYGGKRHRIRVAYAGGGNGCPVTVNIERHPLLIIAIDGKPIVPKEVNYFKIASGERLDFVLSADQAVGGAYRLWVKADPCQGEGEAAVGTALIQYDPLSHAAKPGLKALQTAKQYRILSTSVDPTCGADDTSAICLHQVESLMKLPSDLAADRMDVQLYLPFDFVQHQSSDNFIDTLHPRLCNLTFIFPSSPLLSQEDDAISADVLCNWDNVPNRCIHSTQLCECVHVINIPLHASVELLLIDQGGDSGERIFHLHGHRFYAVGSLQEIDRWSLNTLKALDAQGKLITRNLKNPPAKDTISVPARGLTVLRFIANNPGYWLLHDQTASHWTSGLDVVFKVGNTDDMPPVPDNFPRCGSWVGPEFFLI